MFLAPTKSLEASKELARKGSERASGGEIIKSGYAKRVVWNRMRLEGLFFFET